MPRTKGMPKTGGRTSGTPNKITVEVKAAIEGAFAKLGGENYLVQVGKDQPQVFCALLGRVLPKQLEHSLPESPKQEMPLLEVARRMAFIFAEARRQDSAIVEVTTLSNLVDG